MNRFTREHQGSLAGCGKNPASLDAMPVDCGKPRLFHRSTSWTVFKPEAMDGFFHSQLERRGGAPGEMERQRVPSVHLP